MRTWALVAVAAIAMAAGAALYVSRSRPVPTPVPAAATQATPPVPALVEVLPEFQLTDRTGQLRSLADWQGKALIVNFWATWCAPCRREIPLLRQLARDHAAEGFQVIGIAADFRDKVLAYADEMQIDYPLLIGEQEALDAAAAFGVEAVGLPFTVFSDRQGRIVTSHLGELTAAEADIILGAVREVDAGRLTPAAARANIKASLAALPDTHVEAD
jgi:thiol-disulfide isomerase/thioredoxin